MIFRRVVCSDQLTFKPFQSISVAKHSTMTGSRKQNEVLEGLLAPLVPLMPEGQDQEKIRSAWQTAQALSAAYTLLRIPRIYSSLKDLSNCLKKNTLPII